MQTSSLVCFEAILKGETWEGFAQGDHPKLEQWEKTACLLTFLSCLLYVFCSPASVLNNTCLGYKAMVFKSNKGL